MGLYVRFRKIDNLEIASFSNKEREHYQPVRKVILLSDLKSVLLKLEKDDRWVEIELTIESIEHLKASKVLSGVNSFQEVPLHEGVTKDQ